MNQKNCKIGKQYEVIDVSTKHGKGFIFNYKKIEYCVVNPPFIQSIDDRGIFYVTDLDAICSQCKKPFKEHEEWK